MFMVDGLDYIDYVRKIQHSGQHHSLGSEPLDCVNTGKSKELTDMHTFICLHSLCGWMLLATSSSCLDVLVTWN